MGVLNPNQIERFIGVLSTAFDPFTLNTLVTTRVDKRGLAQYTSLYHALPYQAQELIVHAEAQDFTLDLIQAARELRPKNEEIQALAEEVELTPLGRHPTDKRKGMERIVRQKNVFKDLFLFRTRLTEIEFQVCRIELPATHLTGEKGELTGTGFLVAPDVVMTNYHVIEPLLESVEGWSAKAEDVRRRAARERVGGFCGGGDDRGPDAVGAAACDRACAQSVLDAANAQSTHARGAAHALAFFRGGPGPGGVGMA